MPINEVNSVMLPSEYMVFIFILFGNINQRPLLYTLNRYTPGARPKLNLSAACPSVRQSCFLIAIFQIFCYKDQRRRERFELVRSSPAKRCLEKSSYEYLR